MKQPLPLLIVTILRSAIFDALFFVWGLASSLAGWAAIALPGRMPLFTVAKVWSHGVSILESAVLGLHYTMEGRENLPATPCIIAMQHQSAWETFKLPQWFPGAAVVLKKELLSLPVWGRCADRYGAIPVSRSRKMDDLKHFLEASRAMAAQGRSIVIFPHGTRVAHGQTANYNRGVAALQEDLKLPVVPITLDSGKFWARNAFLRYPGTIRVRVWPPVAAAEHEGLMDALQRLYEAAD